METFALNSFSLNMCVFTVCVCVYKHLEVARPKLALSGPPWLFTFLRQELLLNLEVSISN